MINQILEQTRELRRDLNRQLTSHVATRFYRAPELILMEKDYGKEVDIWATGVIFGELLYTLEANCPNFENRKCLFPGKYCFPLSPNKNADIDEIGIPLTQKSDQLQLIFDMVGSPTREDMSFVTDEKAIKYLERFRNKHPVNLRQKYPSGSDQALRLLTQMLQFNPFFRPNVDTLLQDAYFDEVRQFSKAYNAPEIISLDFELSQEYVGLPKIRELFLNEISYYRELKMSGLSEVSPAPVKNRNVQIFFNAENSYQLKAKTKTPDTANKSEAPQAHRQQ